MKLLCLCGCLLFTCLGATVDTILRHYQSGLVIKHMLNNNVGIVAVHLYADGVVSLLRKQWPRKPDEVIKDLATYQFDPKWKSYWEPKTGSWELMSAVFAHALSGRRVSRTQRVAEVAGNDVTVQELESDGMIWLELAGVLRCPCRYTLHTHHLGLWQP